ncbi:DegT/DnrJ/EryC1/StrS family aminotransferase [Streptomyces sp. enrichment culture]|uniref:DegT/DnrJ/EryC1/StrS family aminotransferase n=1 Tax=Streptomyces sp. enrichment culture TaxID=1795815 RepID=UPI003F55A4DD
MNDAQESIPAARPVIGEEEIEAAVRVLRGGRVVQGPEVAAFEEEFGELVAGRHCVAVNSGTSALHLALLALGIGPGDEVVVPSFSFAASANAVRLAGADVVFADIEADGFCLDPAAVEAALTPRTAAILPVHLYGHPAAMDRITRLAHRHGLAVVEDACQAHAAALHGTPVGAFGDAGAFSFYPTKNMHSLEGGMISTADPALARTLRLLRNQGMEQRYAHELVGANLRMTDVCAAIGRVQRARLAGWTERRIANAAYLTGHITAANVVTPAVAEGARHVYHQYTVRIRGDRDAAAARLTAAGIGTAVYYPTPVHRLKPYWEPDQEAGHTRDLPRTDGAAAEVVSLPVHPGLSQGDLERIVTAVNALEEL